MDDKIDSPDRVSAMLRDLVEAYPLTVFTAVTDKDRADHADIVQRSAAQMGRHFGPTFAKAAQAIDALIAERDTLRAKLEAAKASLDRLTGMKFSDRMSAALLSRAIAAEADAARYRWLKMKCSDVADENGTAGQLYFGTFSAGHLDASIDAARAAQESS